MMSGSTARSGLFPFTASQLQELEHQALIYKYMASGMPIPAHLLYTIKRTCFDISTNLILHQPQHIGWNCFQLGYGKKMDPEPGRCKRTDGKKWRCSKEAYADSKYCERHMHRGRNRSRKPVEVITNNNTSTRITSTSRSPGIGLSSQDYTKFLLDSFAYSRNSYGHGMEEAVSEASVTRRSASGSSSSVDDSWQLAPLTMGSPLGYLKQRTNYSVSQIGQSTNYLQLQSLNNESSKQQQIHNQYYYTMKIDTEDQQQPKKVMHHFFDELPPEDGKDSWLDLESKTQLSISVPNSSLDFITHNGN